MGRPSHTPDPIMRRQVEELASRGMRGIEDPEAHLQLVHDTLELRAESLAGEVEGVRPHLDAVPGAEGGRRRLEHLRAAGEEQQIQPPRGQRLGPRGAETLGGTGHDRPAPVSPQEGVIAYRESSGRHALEATSPGRRFPGGAVPMPVSDAV